MATRPIVQYGDPVLREVTQEVDTVDQGIKDLVSDMADTLKEAQGLGLAAPQIGVSQRVFIVDLTAVDLTANLLVFINPEIIEKYGDDVEMEEGCLSFPGLYQQIVRPSQVKIRATDAEGNQFELDADGMTARVILHEYDHLEGILYIDLLSALSRTLIRGRLKKLKEVS